MSTKQIKLLPHNEKLFNDIFTEMKNGKRSIFYSEGTGLGKSFIFMKLVYDFFRMSKILYISYRNEIWNNIRSYDEFNMIRDVEIDYRCFADFNDRKKITLYSDKYDVIFIDECHHMNSDVQGKNIQLLCKKLVKQRKFVFGFTATPYINGIWVDKEYFECSCYGLDNFEAIEQGLLPKIDLALSINNVDEIPDNLRAQYSISGSKSLLEQIIDDYSDVTHWLGYFSSVKDLEANEIELRRLFPDFKVLKMYEGVENIQKVKEEFNEYDGNVILLSVSMLLEGTHGLKAGGILLFRNVGFTHTYVQIMGRLNKMNSKKSPIMIDITNSILSLDSSIVSNTKSDRCKDNTSNIHVRDIFDVTSKGYKYVELYEQVQALKIQSKEYKGIVWNGSSRDLCRALGKDPNTFHRYKKSHPESTHEDFIDHILNSGHIKEYRGIEWEDGNGSSLSKALGKGANAYRNYSKDHPDITPESYIDYILNGRGVVDKEGMREYRGIKWNGTYKDLCKAIGAKSNRYDIFRRNHPNTTPEQFIDYVLDKKKSYRGIEWEIGNNYDLCRALGKSRSAYYSYKSNHPNATPESYIDYCLSE